MKIFKAIKSQFRAMTRYKMTAEDKANLQDQLDSLKCACGWQKSGNHPPLGTCESRNWGKYEGEWIIPNPDESMKRRLNIKFNENNLKISAQRNKNGGGLTPIIHNLLLLK